MNHREGYAELQSKILDARRVWKRSLFWTGAAIVLTGILAIVVGESIVDWLMPLSSPVRIALLGVVLVATGYLLYRYLIQPLRVSLTLRDVALNIERQYPNLEDRLVSAMQFGARDTTDAIEAHMLQRLLTDTTERIKGIDFKATIDYSRTRKHVGIAFLCLMACGILALLFPTEIHTSLLRVFVPWVKTHPILMTRLAVAPGNSRILSGKSLPIQVTVTGKSAEKVVLVYEKKDAGASGASGAEQEINLVRTPEDKRDFGYEIFNITADMEYYVKANEAISERYTVEVFEMPRVSDVSVAYTYPAYTELTPVVQQGLGDIRAVVGTQAEIKLITNKAIQAATFVVHDTTLTEEKELSAPAPKTIEMNIFDGKTLTTTLDIQADGRYEVKLLCIDGFNNEIPIAYRIKAIPDNAPEVVIKAPGRDVKVTKLEEVRVVAEAKDDYGVAQLSLMYSVGSGQLQELRMETADIAEKNLRKGTYTFYLEEFDVEPGEVISYYAQATDNNTLTGPGKASSDIYFIEVRPFNERFQEAEGEPSPPEPNPFREILASQKQIIRETWRHINAQSSDTSEEYRFAVKKTGEKQSELKGKTQRLVDEISMAMQTAAVAPEILMNLEEAVGKMGEASDSLDAIQPDAAMPPEQDALELLLKVSLEMPKVLTRMRNNNPQLAENLELELEELQSEIEQGQDELEQEMQEKTQAMLEQASQMLEEQQQLNQQNQQLGRENEPSPSEMQQNREQQGELSQQAGNMAHQLNQMQQNSHGSGGTRADRYGQAQQAMQQAQQQMRQAAEGMQQQQPQLSAAKGEQAAAQLEEAIEQLENVSAEFTEDTLEIATQEMQQLMAEQDDVQQQTQQLRNQSEHSEMQVEDFQQASELANQQRGLQRELESLQSTLQTLQEQLSETHPDAARNVADATRRFLEESTAQDMETAQRALQWRSFSAADRNQQEVLKALQQGQDDLQQARANMATTEEEQLETALAQLQRLEEQMQDIQRELQAMEGQEQTPEQQNRTQQLMEQHQQMQERMEQAQQAMQNGQDGQQPGENENQLARAGRESNREIQKLWLELLNSMDYRSSNRSQPLPRYELAIRSLEKLEAALEDRLNTLQEKKRLAQVGKEDVPPEYRRLVDNYYESLSQ